MKFSRLLALSCLLLSAALPAFAAQDYPPQVKPIVEQRCMVCHGCYDAPCQLKLDAYTGLQRGANKTKVYDGTRLRTAKLTRLFEDAQTVEEWRKKDFYPVLDNVNPEQSTLARMLALKEQHPLPQGDVLPASFDLSLDRDQQCVKPEEFDAYANNYPLWGMPYALPGLEREEYDVLTRWVHAGAPGVARPQPPAQELDAVDSWETFFNGDSLKQQLMARYMFEHLFIGNLYFSDLDGGSGYYNLVRSRTPPGKPIDIIATRRPYGFPGKNKFYYRLQPMRTAVLDKRHMPYALNQQRMQRWQELFLNEDYKVTSLPKYGTDKASNPFTIFRELPQDARYKFMLEEARFTIMGFIKGPVCRGQVALNVIDDHFWVVFMNPDRKSMQHSAEFLARESKHLRLPGNNSSLLVTLVEWRDYSENQLKFQRAKFDYIQQITDTEGVKIDLDVIWDGGASGNDNAALTIFRHNDSASVVKGLVGQRPETAWVIDYSLLERIHYLLVAGFDVFGNVAHQLETRLYMDFLRMEGEQNFLFFLPARDRIGLRNFWYRDASREAKQYVMSDSAAFDRDTDIIYQTADTKDEFLSMLQGRQPGGSRNPYSIDNPHFARLQTLVGKPFSLMPEVSLVQVLRTSGGNAVYSILHNNSYSNNAQVFQEAERRIPEEDYLTVVRGFIGSYPNVFFQVPEAQVQDFVAAIEALRSESDYTALVSRYGVRRNAPQFWQVSDQLYQHYQSNYPVEAGLFDLNRYENR